jgi:competence ComEA-like helix-hairpin-helix protein
LQIHDFILFLQAKSKQYTIKIRVLMKNSLQNYFYFTTAERNSAIALAGFCVLLFLVPYSYSYFFTDKEKFEFPALPQMVSYAAREEEMHETKEVTLFPFNPNTATREDFSNLGLSTKVVNSIMNMRSKGWKFYKPEGFQKVWGLSPNDYARLAPYIVIETYKNNYEKKDFNQQETVVELSEPFPFSPNLASPDDLLRLGIPQRVVNSIMNFRSKGWVFRNKEAVRKIYNFPPDLFAKLEPFMIFEEKKSNWNNTQVVDNQNIAANQTNNPTSQTTPPTSYNIPTNAPAAYDNATKFSSKKNFNGTIDINQATPAQWQQLPGVGAGYANKIVNFREKLGGFNTPEQVKETFGLPDSTFQKIKLFLKASPILKTININTVTSDELSKHPYCKFNHAKLIIAYRDMHGKYANAEAIKKVYGVQDILPKLLPYLSY